MIKKRKMIFLTASVILLFFSEVTARDPGSACDPDVDTGHTARLGAGTNLTLTGGLHCSDMRPKLDGGRWSARELAMELAAGNVEI